ncbi:hypothetical protein U1Q18_026086 [Sarracenia purpurea var. burkii]
MVGVYFVPLLVEYFPPQRNVRCMQRPYLYQLQKGTLVALCVVDLANLKSCCKPDFIRQVRIVGCSEADAVRKYGHAVDIVVAVNGVSSVDHRNPKSRLNPSIISSSFPLALLNLHLCSSAYLKDRHALLGDGGNGIGATRKWDSNRVTSLSLPRSSLGEKPSGAKVG